MMTRRDYIRVAKIVCDAWPVNRPQRRPARLGYFIRAMADMMAEDNESFEPDKFMRACGEGTSNGH